MLKRTLDEFDRLHERPEEEPSAEAGAPAADRHEGSTAAEQDVILTNQSHREIRKLLAINDFRRSSTVPQSQSQTTRPGSAQHANVTASAVRGQCGNTFEPPRARRTQRKAKIRNS